MYESWKDWPFTLSQHLASEVSSVAQNSYLMQALITVRVSAKSIDIFEQKKKTRKQNKESILGLAQTWSISAKLPGNMYIQPTHQLDGKQPRGSVRRPSHQYLSPYLTCLIFWGELNGMCLSSCTLTPFLSSSSSSSLARQTCVREEEGDGQKHKTMRSAGS